MRSWLVLGAWIACNGGTEPTDAVEDPDVEVGCVRLVDALSQTLEGVREASGELRLESDCRREVVVEGWELESLAAGFAVEDSAELRLQGGGSGAIGLSFEAAGGGLFEEALIVRIEGEEPARVPLRMEVVAPEFTVTADATTLVRACPTEVTLSAGSGPVDATWTEVTTRLDGEVIPASTAGPVDMTAGLGAQFSTTVDLRTETGTLQVAVEDRFSGPLTWDFPLTTDPNAERTLELPAWTDGRPLDVFISVDRRLPGYDGAAVERGLQALLDRLDGMDADVRAVGLLRDDGCPMGGGAVDAKDGRAGAATLAAQLDLAFNRVSSTGIEDRPFELVSVALDPANTKDGGCNDWLRPSAARLMVHVAGGDDASASTVADHLSVASFGLPSTEHLAVSSVAPRPPDGCEGRAAGVRLEEASRTSGGRFADVCGADFSTVLGGLAMLPGEENEVLLEEAPHPPSVEVLVDGRQAEFTLDGRLLTLPRSVDRFRSAVSVRYVRAEACPGG